MYNPYYYINGYGGMQYRGENDNEIISLNEAIELIRQSIGNEMEDEVFYSKLIDEAPTEKAKEIIISIRDDERKHYRILKNLYSKFTGQMFMQNVNSVENNNRHVNEESNSDEYRNDLEKALMGELDAVVRYRRILGAMPDDDSYILIMSIMTDELRHASKYNYLIHLAH